ncbi:YggT family protein [Zophobihabitans entericus]|uniref:YggT family protein n=1 Tax=Zophobihabitans entericus TaxID=1635327 RepID=A0A6G9ICL9_9GAMM|nr:YggT family protein [Zophobihabitans entericus]QIQ21330.1 YggT family protein [Zophobihabitans entericus]
MASIFYIVNTILTVGIYVFILRLWMQYARVNFYNPFTQFVLRITQPIVGPLRRIIPSIGRIDTSIVLVTYIIALIKVIFITTYALKWPVWNMMYLFYGILAMFHALGHLIFWMLLVRAILSWINRGQSPVEDLLAQLTEPLIRPIRRIVPPFGSIDISFMIFVFALIALNLIATDLFGIVWMLL